MDRDISMRFWRCGRSKKPKIETSYNSSPGYSQKYGVSGCDLYQRKECERMCGLEKSCTEYLITITKIED
jgi:hypothetical protein